MSNWEEREKRVHGEPKSPQIEIDEEIARAILEKFSVQKLLTEIKNDVWQEGNIREIRASDEDNLTTGAFIGYELVSPISTIEAERYCGSISCGGPHEGSGNQDQPSYCGCREVTSYSARVGEVEVGLRVKVCKRDSEFRYGRWIKEHDALSISDSPFSTQELMWGPSRRCISRGSNLRWFPALQRINKTDYWHRGDYSNVAHFDDFGKFERHLVYLVGARRSVNNLPAHMRIRNLEAIENMPSFYERVQFNVDIMESFREWLGEPCQEY